MVRHPLARLRSAVPGFAHLPDRIETSWRSVGLSEPLPVTEATIDDLAFAIAGAASHLASLQASLSALEHLYHLACNAGCKGTDRAVTTVLKGREA